MVYSLNLILRSVGHKVKIHKVTGPDVGNERGTGMPHGTTRVRSVSLTWRVTGDVEIMDYVVLPHGKDNRFPPRPLILDVVMTHDLNGRTITYTNGNLTYTLSSNDTPQSDGILKNTDTE